MSKLLDIEVNIYCLGRDERKFVERDRDWESQVPSHMPAPGEEPWPLFHSPVGMPRIHNGQRFMRLASGKHKLPGGRYHSTRTVKPLREKTLRIRGKTTSQAQGVAITGRPEMGYEAGNQFWIEDRSEEVRQFETTIQCVNLQTGRSVVVYLPDVVFQPDMHVSNVGYTYAMASERRANSRVVIPTVVAAIHDLTTFDLAETLMDQACVFNTLDAADRAHQNKLFEHTLLLRLPRTESLLRIALCGNPVSVLREKMTSMEPDDVSHLFERDRSGQLKLSLDKVTVLTGLYPIFGLHNPDVSGERIMNPLTPDYTARMGDMTGAMVRTHLPHHVGRMTCTGTHSFSRIPPPVTLGRAIHASASVPPHLRDGLPYGQPFPIGETITVGTPARSAPTPLPISAAASTAHHHAQPPQPPRRSKRRLRPAGPVPAPPQTSGMPKRQRAAQNDVAA